MYWEQIGFCIFVVGFIMLSSIKTFDKRRHELIRKKLLEKLARYESSSKLSEEEKKEKAKLEPYDGKGHLSKYIKVMINYCVSFNSSFLVVGSLAESYLYGVRMVGNIISITLGYIYAFLIIQPFMYSLDPDIKTPYQYFERRYNNKKYVRAITAGAGMLFYFLFLTLYLWGCANLLSSLIPQIPLWLSSLIIGIYSMIGSPIGGFTQSTKTNVFQFIILLAGLLMALLFTLNTNSNLNPTQIWQLAVASNRTKFFDTSADFTTRYTIINQALSLSMPWTCVHSLFLPNFIRYRAIPGKLRARFLIISNFPFMFCVNLILLISGGILCFVYFYGCDPIVSAKVTNKNQLGTYWLYLILSDNAPSFSGILFASIIAYSVVQHSMGMALLSRTIISEIIKPLLIDQLIKKFKFKNSNNKNKNNNNENDSNDNDEKNDEKNEQNNGNLLEKYIDWLRIGLGLIFGALSILLSIAFKQVRNTMLSLFFLFNNSINSPILGLFLLSAFNPYANHAGAMLAFVCNLAINFWLGLGASVVSRLKSQEFAADISQCNDPYHLNMTILNVYYGSSSSSSSSSSLSSLSISSSILTQNINNNSKVFIQNSKADDYYPKNATLAYLYSIAPIWYCLFSVLFNIVFGSLFSFIYSIIRTRSFDSDFRFSKERKQYLYYYRMFKKDSIDSFQVKSEQIVSF